MTGYRDKFLTHSFRARPLVDLDNIVHLWPLSDYDRSVYLSAFAAHHDVPVGNTTIDRLFSASYINSPINTSEEGERAGRS